MRYLGNDQYEIENVKTGEKRTVNSGELSNYGLSPDPSAEADTNQQGGAIKGVSNLLSSFGLGAIPGAAASLYEAPGFVARGFKSRPVEEAQKDNPFLTNQKIQSIKKTRTDKTEPFKQAGSEALGLGSWMVPGGIEGKALTRFGLGAIQGATSAISQKEDVGKVALDSVLAGGINTVLPGAANKLVGAGKYITEKIPADIKEKIITQPAKKMSQLVDRGIRTIVGHQDADFAIKNGIIDRNTFKGVNSETINDALQKTYNQLQEKETKLQGILTDSSAMIPYRPVKSKIKEIIDKSPPNLNTPDKQAISSWLDDRLLEGLPGGNKNILVSNDFIQGKTLGDLATLNELKRSLYKENSPVFREIYTYLNDYIGKASGVPNEVKGLNKEMGSLIRIKNNLLKSQEGKLPETLTETSIQNTVDKAKQGDVGSLDVLLRTLGVLSFPALSQIPLQVAGANLGGGLGGVGGAYFLYSALKKISQKPEVKANIMNVLKKTGDKSRVMSDLMKVPAIAKIINAVAVRAPSAIQSGGGGSY